MKFIDSHMHIGGNSTGHDMSEALLKNLMDKYNVTYGIVSSCDCAEFDDKLEPIDDSFQVTQEEALLKVLELAKSEPDRIGAAIWVRPYFQSVTKQLREMIDENRPLIKAIKLHPFHSKLSPVDEKVLPFLKLAAEYELTVVSHTGGCVEASPSELCKAAKMFPKIPFVMVHMGLGTDNSEALELMAECDNLYGDTTWVPVKTTLEAIKRYGSERIVFGSDAPIDGLDTYRFYPDGNPSVYHDYFYELPKMIAAKDYENIMFNNSKNIFKI